ncbi:MAG: prolyl oligopeptidase family serine peptidase, partial [Usitatibacteraceae bacterium]
MQRCFLQFIVAVSCAFIYSPAASAEPRSIKETDIFGFKWIGDPQLARDGADVAYVLVNVDDKRENYETSVWRVTTANAEARQLTMGKHDFSPRWSPDGKWLAFLRQGDKDASGKPAPAQLWVLPMNGGEAQQLTRLPKGAANPVWSNDGKTIAFLSGTNSLDLTTAACAADPAADKKKCTTPRQTDVQVITRAVYRANGQGYLDFSRPNHIWTIAFTPAATTAPEAKQLTRGDFDERELVWAANDERICYATNRNLEPYDRLPEDVIACVPVAVREDGKAIEMLKFPGRVGALSMNPQGTQLAFLAASSTPVQSHSKTNLWVVDLAPGAAAKNVSAKHDWEIGGGIINDQGTPRAGGEVKPLWSADGQAITVVVAQEGRANLERFNLRDGSITKITDGDQAVTRYTSNGKDVVALISNPSEINDLFFIDGNGGKPKRLTSVNQIHALVQLPPDFDPKKKYPLILNIHGGPHATYGYAFFHEMQWMAAKGYVVLYPNPRGSTSYGEAFANVIQYRYPGDDYKDLMAGVDELIRQGYVDEKRLGVTGGSGGGLLTNWVIGHT